MLWVCLVLFMFSVREGNILAMAGWFVATISEMVIKGVMIP